MIISVMVCPESPSSPSILEVVVMFSPISIKDQFLYSFGSNHTGNQTIWIVKFATEYKGAWANNADPLYHLVQDCQGVSITTGIDDTATFALDVFDTDSTSNDMNLYFVRNDEL